MTLYEEVLESIHSSKERLETGKLNCIPFPYERFRKIFPGLEKGTYHIVTGNQKTAKTKWVDYTFLYEPFFDMLENPDAFKLKVFYYTLELSPKYKMMEFMCHALYRYTEGEMRYSPRNMKNLDPKNVFPKEALEIVESEPFKEICRKWEECVEYITTDANPTGINKHIKSYANRPENGKIVETESGVKYIDYHPEVLKLVVVDNAANVPLERGYTERENIIKLSKYMLGARNFLGYSIVMIQHQTMVQEGVEMRKFNSGRPTTSGLGNAKESGRDINMVWGIYSPHKMEKKEYAGYDITRLGNYSRFVEVLEDRDGNGTGCTLPLLFDGAVTIFDELPHPDSAEMNAYYDYVERIEKPISNHVFMMHCISKLKKPFYKHKWKAIFAFLKHLKLWE